MDSCDVLIVGGGPGGSSCAWGLRAAGLRVVILDKSVFPRDKVCGGWITPAVLEALAIDPEDYGRGRILQPVTGFRISAMNQPQVQFAYDRIVSYGVRRREFDEFLLRRSGAEVQEGAPLSSLERSGNSWIINGKMMARVLVGAGGHFCPVSRFVGNDNDGTPVVAQEVEFEMNPKQAASCAIQEEVPELYFCRDLMGYGWCFRKGNYLNIGLGRLDQHGLPEQTRRFLEFLRTSGRLAFDPPSRTCGHAYLLWQHARHNLVDESVVLVGDAAGLAYSQSGEGILPAVESALLAAHVIRSAGGCYGRDRLARYHALLAKRFSSSSQSETLARHVPLNIRNSIARWLLRKKWFCRRVIADRWFLHTHENQAPEVL